MSRSFSLYNLDPPSARLCLEVEKYSALKLNPLMGRRLLLALSGGADSTALACIFSSIAARSNLYLQGIYINHKIRPVAMEEAEFVARLCERLSIPFFYAEFDAPMLAGQYGIGLEEAGRKGRYALLESWREKTASDNILVAHHSGDLSEDILLRLIRGVGWPALGGMRSLNGYIFRPLLHISRERLINFLKFLEQGWCEDLSNNELSFRRNRLRTNLIPLLKSENPSIERSFRNLHTLSLADEEFWRDYIEEVLKADPCQSINDSFGHGLVLSVQTILGRSLAVRLRIYHYIINKLIALYPSEKARPQIQFDKIVALDNALLARRCGKIFQFQGGLLVRLYRDKIVFALQNGF